MIFSRQLIQPRRRLHKTLAASLTLWASYTTTTVSAMATSNTKVIDSHLHVWANSKEASTGFPYADGKEPPENLRDKASTAELLKKMDASGVDGALIVQPINHEFDHSYVVEAMKSNPRRFKGMLLHDPSLAQEAAVARLENLALQGFVGVRFNPYLWPKTEDGVLTKMSNPSGAGIAVYKRCAELNMPVGVMCFQGLNLHYDDILELIEASPDTTLILDHFGFTGLDEEGNAAFEKLLELSRFPNVIVKISALFRLKDESPYKRVEQERLKPLLEKFGSDRLMFGTDFPFVLEQPESYEGMVKLTSSWLSNDQDRHNVMGGTAERIFGTWGSGSPPQRN